MTDKVHTNSEAMFPIGTVSERTGVPSVTLRAWERRYGLLQPCRTPKGHRLYSERDIKRVQQVLKLLDQGVPVGRVCDVLDTKSAEHLLKPDNLVNLCPSQAQNPWPHFEALCRRFVCKLDTRSLEQVINEAVNLYSLELVARKLLLPLCHDLHGQSCMLASTRAEHAFWYEFICTKLGAFYLHNNAQTQCTGRRVIILGTSSQVVHLQMLLLAGILGGHGFHSSLLGAGCGLEHLPLVLERSRFDAIIFCSPTADVLAGMEVLSRLTTTRLLVQYLEIPPDVNLPAGVRQLPPAFGDAALQLEQFLCAEEEGSA